MHSKQCCLTEQYTENFVRLLNILHVHGCLSAYNCQVSLACRCTQSGQLPSPKMQRQDGTFLQLWCQAKSLLAFPVRHPD
jgi:hypothetical protein